MKIKAKLAHKKRKSKQFNS